MSLVSSKTFNLYREDIIDKWIDTQVGKLKSPFVFLIDWTKLHDTIDEIEQILWEKVEIIVNNNFYDIIKNLVEKL